MKKFLIVSGFVLLLCLPSAFAQEFQLSVEATEARFYIDEVLFGRDKTVIGVTSDVSGSVSFDLANPQGAVLSPIVVNARALETDDNRRNGQIQRRILQSNQDEFQFITFEPIEIVGLPESVAVGESFQAQVVGNLSIREVTREESFDLTVNVIDASSLTGLASTVILYADYGISIPSVPIVTGVADEVRLELEFTAVQAE